MKSKKVLVTGATGFIGCQLCKLLVMTGYEVRAVVRNSQHCLPNLKKLEVFNVADINGKTNWTEALEDIDVIIHLAARAHVLKESSVDPIESFREINTYGTLNIASQAAKVGVRRFIYLSSIGVLGNKTTTSPFSSGSIPNPVEPYAVSKLEAERELFRLKSEYECAMEVVVIRPPLVYGANAPGNFGRLIKALEKGVSLPLGAVNNKRSFVALDNLVSFIIHCIDHSKAANEIFLISDDEDVSTTELMKKISKAFDRPSRLIPIPVKFMYFVAKVLRKKDMANRLFSSLQIDSSKATELLGWKPVVTMDEALKKIADNLN